MVEKYGDLMYGLMKLELTSMCLYVITCVDVRLCFSRFSPWPFLTRFDAVNNQPHDEEVELSDDDDDFGGDEDEGSPGGSNGMSSLRGYGDSPSETGGDSMRGPRAGSDDYDPQPTDPRIGRRGDDNDDDRHGVDVDDDVDDVDDNLGATVSRSRKMNHAATAGRNMPTLDMGGHTGGGDDEDDDVDDAAAGGGGGEDDDGGDGGSPVQTRVPKYDPADYVHLNEQVSGEIASLFELIGGFTPTHADLGTRLKCFVPEYMPAMGDVDEFIKVARPDGRTEEAGLRVLDEPSVHQSDTAVLDLHLRQSSKQIGSQPVEVAAVRDPGRNPARVASWIKSIEELHKSKHALRQPGGGPGNGIDIEALMAEWGSADFATAVRRATRGGRLGACDALSIAELARVMCALLGIPIQDTTNVVEPLHTMMMLYLAFDSNPIYNTPTTDHQALL